MRAYVPILSTVLVSALIPACTAPSGDGADGGISDDKKRHDAAVEKDAREPIDAAGSGSGGGDGTPVRNTCTSKFAGNSLNTPFGRLDGTIYSIVPPKSGSACNEDTTHVHIQVEMDGDVYDVAVNVDGGFYYEDDIAIPDGAWSEGWHGTDKLDYANTLKIKSTAFTSISQSALTTLLENDLATVNHISVFGTSYTGSDAGTGMHDIHRQATNEDGALVLEPLSGTAKVLLFRFSSDKF